MTVAVFAVFVMMVLMIAIMVMIMIVAMAFLAVVMVMVVMLVVMVVVVTAGAFMLVYLEVDTAVLHRMFHGMLQISLVDVGDRRHEVEIGLPGWFQTVVVLDTRLQIREVESDAFAVDGDGHLDVAHEITSLLLDPSADLHHHGIQPYFGICIETVYVTGESCAHSARLLR